MITLDNASAPVDSAPNPQTQSTSIFDLYKQQLGSGIYENPVKDAGVEMDDYSESGGGYAGGNAAMPDTAPTSPEQAINGSFENRNSLKDELRDVLRQKAQARLAASQMFQEKAKASRPNSPNLPMGPRGNTSYGS